MVLTHGEPPSHGHGQDFWGGRTEWSVQPVRPLTRTAKWRSRPDSSHGPASLSLHVSVKSVPVLRATGERDVWELTVPSTWDVWGAHSGRVCSQTRWFRDKMAAEWTQTSRETRYMKTSCLIILMFGGPVFQKSHVIHDNCLRCLSSSKITENWGHHVSGLEDSVCACLLSFIFVFASTSTLNMDAPLQASGSRWHLKKLGLFLLLQRVNHPVVSTDDAASVPRDAGPKGLQPSSRLHFFIF